MRALRVVWATLVCIPLFVAASLLLIYGSTMLFLVPGYPGENYFGSLIEGRFVYGVLPFVSGVAMLVTTRWLWSRQT